MVLLVLLVVQLLVPLVLLLVVVVLLVLPPPSLLVLLLQPLLTSSPPPPLPPSLSSLPLPLRQIVLLHHSCTSVGPRATKDPLKSNGLLWAGLEKALAMGLTRAIGVSNYNVTCLESLKKTMKIKPAINQVRCVLRVVWRPLPVLCCCCLLR